MSLLDQIMIINLDSEIEGLEILSLMYPCEAFHKFNTGSFFEIESLSHFMAKSHQKRRQNWIFGH